MLLSARRSAIAVRPSLFVRRPRHIARHIASETASFNTTRGPAESHQMGWVLHDRQGICATGGHVCGCVWVVRARFPCCGRATAGLLVTRMYVAWRGVFGGETL
eukprot:137765-Prymnesium_polylepis.1